MRNKLTACHAGLVECNQARKGDGIKKRLFLNRRIRLHIETDSKSCPLCLFVSKATL
jgi:hypothetical protein